MTTATTTTTKRAGERARRCSVCGERISICRFPGRPACRVRQSWREAAALGRVIPHSGMNVILPSPNDEGATPSGEGGGEGARKRRKRRKRAVTWVFAESVATYARLPDSSEPPPLVFATPEAIRCLRIVAGYVRMWGAVGIAPQPTIDGWYVVYEVAPRPDLLALAEEVTRRWSPRVAAMALATFGDRLAEGPMPTVEEVEAAVALTTLGNLSSGRRG